MLYFINLNRKNYRFAFRPKKEKQYNKSDISVDNIATHKL